MTVTKQQQLEWLAKHFDFDLQHINYVIMSSTKTGLIIGSGTSTAPESSALSTRRHIVTRQEWQQERDKMQKQSAQPTPDNSWCERGELPPVGCECYIRHSCWNSEKYEKVTVAAITNEYVIVKYATFEQHYMLNDISFRPLRTEREKAIDAVCMAIGDVGEDGLLLIERLYDAGLLK